MIHRLQVPHEHEEQKAVIDWCNSVGRLRWPDICLPDGRFPMASNGNGAPLAFVRGQRDNKAAYQMAAKLKREGRSAGFPDLFLAVRRPAREYDGGEAGRLVSGPRGGLFIEMKRRKGGVISPDQKAWCEALERQGYRVRVCRGSDEAIAAIEEYLG